MGTILPILGAGIYYGNVALRGNTTFTDFDDADHPGGIEIQFYSITGELIGVIGSNYEQSNLKSVEIKINKIGELIGFNFTVGRRLDIPFYNDMETRFYINGIHWFTGLMVYEPDQGRRNVQYQYQGKGFWDYTKRTVINELYNDKTLDFAIKDIITTHLVPNSRIVYNPDLINPPSLTMTDKLEINDKTIEKAFEKLIKYANFDYKNHEYRMGVNLNNEIFFEEIDRTIAYGFFEGYQFQNPDIEVDTDDLVNKIRIYRCFENNQIVEFVLEISDADSINEWGERKQKLLIPDYADNTNLTRLAQAKLELRKDPRVKMEINELTVDDEPYDFASYNISSRHAEYSINVSDFEALASWSIQAVVSTITRSQEQVFSKNAAFKVVQASGSSGDYLEFTIDEAVYFPSTLILYVNQNVAGEFFFITIYDDWGNQEDIGENIFLMTEADDNLTTEDNDLLIADQLSFRVDILGDFVRLELPINVLDNIKRIRITLTADESVTLFFDRLDLVANIWKKEELIPDEFLYLFAKGNSKVKATFGEKTLNIIDDIKKIDKKTLEILSIFEKW